MKESMVVLQTNVDGEKVICMPITKLQAIEDTASVKTAADNDDYFPIIDSSDYSQMKKITVGNLLSDVSKKATAAQTAAEAAQSTANTAKSTADAAKKTATAAQTAAEAATTAAANAQATADSAATAASEAKSATQVASGSAAGIVSTSAQTFAGDKTFNGKVIPAGASDVGTAQARKIYAGTDDMTAGTSELETGAIYLVYE